MVRPNEAETQTASGLVIPDTAKEKPQQGEVLAVGPGKRSDTTGELIPVGIDTGDTVLYSKYGGTEVTVDGEACRTQRPRRPCDRRELNKEARTNMAKILKFDDGRVAPSKRASTSSPTQSTVTIGPKGRNVVLDKKFGAPTITNDGVSIAKESRTGGPVSRTWAPSS